MRVRCRTNIDCCKPFMDRVSSNFVSGDSPIIGDDIVVYRDSNKIVELRVVNRTWYENELEIELHLKPIWHGRFTEFEKWVKE